MIFLLLMTITRIHEHIKSYRYHLLRLHSTVTQLINKNFRFLEGVSSFFPTTTYMYFGLYIKYYCSMNTKNISLQNLKRVSKLYLSRFHSISDHTKNIKTWQNRLRQINLKERKCHLVMTSSGLDVNYSAQDVVGLKIALTWFWLSLTREYLKK